ncbi:MAG: 50S ribosomal protein L23 [Planctomycetota bacterium]
MSPLRAQAHRSQHGSVLHPDPSPGHDREGFDDIHTRNAYHFRVPTNAGKIEVRQAVEQVFGVRVRSVNTIKVNGKVRRSWLRRRYQTRLAIVTLHPTTRSTSSSP